MWKVFYHHDRDGVHTPPRSFLVRPLPPGAGAATQAARGTGGRLMRFLDRAGQAHAGVTAIRSAELLGQGDDDPLGATDVAEPIAVLVLDQLADELGAVGA
ncbi:hypothetical protein GCM10007977_106360 [Dactylosporangium sucinum]|uniref:Uncharacterized protein n=1 Tax=Dactylosporangium sucinum TaxID=1424081 RepID=A0A917X8A3_9ACTN|nr:hypothetical protein GCM10007977_106360 [Dactylosporangium sucinum]